MPDKGWSRTFDDLIPLPDGGELRTLRDAANYITKLPKAEHDAPAWQAAIEALMLVADRGGPTMLARIGMMRALYPDGPAPTRRKKAARKYGIVRSAPAPIDSSLLQSSLRATVDIGCGSDINRSAS